MWRLFPHQSKVFYSLHTDIYALKRGKIVYFHKLVEEANSQSNGLYCIFHIWEKMKSLSIWYLHTCQFVSESNTFDFWFHHLMHKHQKGKLHMKYFIWLYYMMSILNLWSENISLSSTVKFEVFERVSWINDFYP